MIAQPDDLSDIDIWISMSSKENRLLDIAKVVYLAECSVGADDVSIKVRGRKQYVRLCPINLHVWWERGEA